MNEARANGNSQLGRRTLVQRLAGEFRLFLVLFLYLWVLFGLFVLNQDIVLRQQGDTLAFQGFAILNAMILAKVMLVAEHMHFARWLRDKPVIATILFEAALCTLIFLVFHIVERLVVDLVKGAYGSENVLSIGGGGWLGLAIVGVMLFVSLLPFFAFKNVMRAVGIDRIGQILLNRPARGS